MIGTKTCGEPTLEEVLARHPSLDRIEVRPPDNRREVKSYVLRGQKLSPRQIDALDRRFDDLCLAYSPSPLDFEAVFGNRNPVVIEIGFGMGEATFALASANPATNYLGFEVFLFGFSKLLRRIDEAGLRNIRLMRFDAASAIGTMVPDGSVAGFHIFFPDPWPKKRHAKRRLVQEPFAALLAGKLAPGGYIYAATDDEAYARQMLSVFGGCQDLENPYGGFASGIGWRPRTGFERKGLEAQRGIFEVWFEKKA